MTKSRKTGIDRYPLLLECDAPGCGHPVVGQSEKHVKDKLANHKKTGCKSNGK